MSKLYFSNDDDQICYPVAYYRQLMIDNNLPQITLYQATRLLRSDYFFCSLFEVVGEVGDCSKFCEGYKPCNGISGRCVHYRWCYEKSNTKLILYNAFRNA